MYDNRSFLDFQYDICTESSSYSKQLVRGISKQKPIRAGETDPDIYGMSYNSARDELFLADRSNKVVRAMHLRGNAGYLLDVYRGTQHDSSPSIYSVCHMSDTDTLLVCSGECGRDKKPAYWLVALIRNGSEWREAQRVQMDRIGGISCALSDSRVLVGQWNSTNMELFRMESGPQIVRVHRIHVLEKYYWFSATCGSDTLVAMRYEDMSVRVHRLRDDRLEELARTQLKRPGHLLWLENRLLVVDGNWKSDTILELEVRGIRLERRRVLIEKVFVQSWCAMDDGLVICNGQGLLHYSIA